MIKENDYKLAAGREGGGAVNLGVQVRIAGVSLTEAEEYEARLRCDQVYEFILKSKIKNDPANTLHAEEVVARLTSCFPTPIYVERIPNEYSEYSVHPWLIVTTTRGRIKAGWRSRVIVVDWSDSAIKARAADLFPTEDVTKGEQMIHAWGYEDCKRYVAAILAST